MLTLGEIRRGVEKLQQGERQRTLRIWLEQELPTFFAGRVLPIDGAVAHRWAQRMAKLGRPLPAIDSLLAATALEQQPGADQPQSQGCGGLACGRGQSLGSAQLAQTSGGERYLHWDELRHRPAPQGLSHEQWWLKDGKRDFFHVPADIPARLQN